MAVFQNPKGQVVKSIHILSAGVNGPFRIGFNYLNVLSYVKVYYSDLEQKVTLLDHQIDYIFVDDGLAIQFVEKPGVNRRGLLIITREVDVDQTTAFNLHMVTGANVERAVDKLTMIAQDQNAYQRYIRLPKFEDVKEDMLVLPEPVKRSLSFLGFDVNGDMLCVHREEMKKFIETDGRILNEVAYTGYYGDLNHQPEFTTNFVKSIGTADGKNYDIYEAVDTTYVAGENVGIKETNNSTSVSPQFIINAKSKTYSHGKNVFIDLVDAKNAFNSIYEINATNTTYVAGENVSIKHYVQQDPYTPVYKIDAQVITYTAGSGIKIDNTVISHDLKAGEGISIDGNVITCTKENNGSGGSDFSKYTPVLDSCALLDVETFHTPEDTKNPDHAFANENFVTSIVAYGMSCAVGKYGLLVVQPVLFSQGIPFRRHILHKNVTYFLYGTVFPAWKETNVLINFFTGNYSFDRYDILFYAERVMEPVTKIVCYRGKVKCFVPFSMDMIEVDVSVPDVDNINELSSCKYIQFHNDVSKPLFVYNGKIYRVTLGHNFKEGFKVDADPIEIKDVDGNFYLKNAFFYDIFHYHCSNQEIDTVYMLCSESLNSLSSTFIVEVDLRCNQNFNEPDKILWGKVTKIKSAVAFRNKKNRIYVTYDGCVWVVLDKIFYFKSKFGVFANGFFDIRERDYTFDGTKMISSDKRDTSIWIITTQQNYANLQLDYRIVEIKNACMKNNQPYFSTGNVFLFSPLIDEKKAFVKEFINSQDVALLALANNSVPKGF